jgi:hypothetical protein
MYFRRKIFLLDQQQLKRITGKSHAAAALKLIEQMDGVNATASCSVKKAAHCYENAHGVSAPNGFTIDQPDEKYITVDDCTNLRIELELCRDSQQFIDRM